NRPAPVPPARRRNPPDKRRGGGRAPGGRGPSPKRDYKRGRAGGPPADKERILNEAVNALAKAVTDHGLSVEEYVSFLVMAQNDRDVRKKIRQRPSAQLDQE